MDKTKTITLTDIQIIRIQTALNYYGDVLADKFGYSSGEPYWELRNIFD